MTCNPVFRSNEYKKSCEDSPTISKKLANKMIFFVVRVLSDQCPNSGPDSRPLRLNADKVRPRKYGAASKVCKYLHIVGNITAGERENVTMAESDTREKYVLYERKVT